MQARGKTCFWQKQEILLKQKSEMVFQKKATEKIEVPKNQLKKCKLEVRRVFWNTRKKGAPKVQPQMKHTKHNNHPKRQLCTTRWWYSVSTPPHYVIVTAQHPCLVADYNWPMKATNTAWCTCKMQRCIMNGNLNPEILKAVNEIAVQSRRNDAWQRP